LKRTYVALALLIMILIAVTGCASAKKGSLDFAMDLSSLLKNEAVNRAGITKVTVTLTRTGYDTIIQDLTVSNNVATGRVDNLAAGYWNVKMVVFDGTTALFTGERDIEIVAGLVQQVTILVDPGTDPPTTGSIAFNIGLNPFPGFKPQYQPISGIAMDSAGGKLYVLDATTKRIAVYNADTMTRERDLSVTQAPTVIQLNWNNTAILMGYPTGKIFSLDITSGVSTQIADLSMPINLLFPFGDKYLVAANGDYNTKIKVWASDTQSIVDSETVSYGPTIAWELNPGIQTAYFVALNLHRARLDYSTGNGSIGITQRS